MSDQHATPVVKQSKKAAAAANAAAKVASTEAAAAAAAAAAQEQGEDTQAEEKQQRAAEDGAQDDADADEDGDSGSEDSSGDEAAEALADALEAAEQAREQAELMTKRANRLAQRSAAGRAVAAGIAAASAAASTPPPPRLSQPSRPLDKRYEGAGGIELDDWIGATRRTIAFYTGLDGASAVRFLATGLDGAAASFFDELNAPPTDAEALYSALRKRFQPVNSEETARRELDGLRQGQLSVNDYTTRFRQLVARLPTDSAPTRIFQYCRGLQAAIEDKIAQAEPQPMTLDAVISLAARLEGRAGSSRKNGNQLSAAELEELPASVAQLNALLDKAVSRGAAAAKAAYDTRANRGSNPRGDPLWKVVGLTYEEGQKRRSTNACMHCGVVGHIYRDCVNRLAKKPAKLN